MITVPWLPWLAPHEEVPGEVVLLLYLILGISHTKGVITGSVLLRELSALTELTEDDLEFYLCMAMELGIVGGIEMSTGLDVTVEHVSAAEARAADPSMN